MNFCSVCGQPVNLIVPEGDNRERHVCISCGYIHYQNPRVVTGVIPEWQGRILLCKRSIEPRNGLWTLPAGFLENGETVMQGAAREAMEEANADIRDMKLFSVFSIPHINQIYTFYRGDLHQGMASPGDESEQVELVEEADIPWQQLAFQVVIETLKLFLEDRRNGEFRVHNGEIIKTADQQYEVNLFN